MDVVAFAVVLIALTAFVAAPLYARSSRVEPSGHSARIARRETLLSALRELEIDRASGLITDDAYERERAALEAETAGLDAD
jgi:hypothetical protein